MIVPHPLFVRKISKYLATFLLGALAGGIVIFYMYGHLMDEILLENRQLHLTTQKLEEEYEQLEKDRDQLSLQNREILIQKIEIEIVKDDDYDIDGFTEAEVMERLRRDMRFLLQLPVESAAETSEIIRQLVNGRKYEIQQQQIGIRLETLVLHSTTIIKISLHKTGS